MVPAPAPHTLTIDKEALRMQPRERISAKLSKFHTSLTLALKALSEERREEGLPVYDFGLGETKGELASHIREAGKRAFDEGQTMYADPSGLPELRGEVLNWLGLEDHYSIDSVVITAGAKQALFNTFLAICNPSDAVLLDAAPWVSYQPLATAAYGFPVMVIPARGAAGQLKAEPEDLRRNLRMRPHAKMFVLNNPCNPTGQLYSLLEIEELLHICVEHEIYFVLDRLYWKILFDGRRYPAPLVNAETRRWLIQIDGMSKNFRRTGGIRIGWSVAPGDVARAMANLQSHYTAGPARPAQGAALAAIRHEYDSDLVEELQGKRDLLHAEAKEMPHVNIWPTPATFYSFWDVRQTFGMKTPGGDRIEDSNGLSRYLIRSEGVITASGSAFMQNGYLRLCFATEVETIQKGMAAARRALGALR